MLLGWRRCEISVLFQEVLVILPSSILDISELSFSIFNVPHLIGSGFVDFSALCLTSPLAIILQQGPVEQEAFV